MEIKNKVFRRKSGKSAGKWVVRLDYFDDINGKPRTVERQAEKKSEAIDLRDQLINDIRKSFGQIQIGERMTFEQLADYCERHFYQPATIIEGKKVAGVRSVNTAKTQLTILKKFFGKRLIKEITSESLNDYKLWRLKSKSERTGKAVKISTVNRELSAMRTMMSKALAKGWILKDIFFASKVIEKSDEVARTRLLSLNEEKRLLENCQGVRTVTYKRKKKGDAEQIEEISSTISSDNPHLKAMILLALDSGLRRGEIFKLSWDDIDHDNSVIRILGTHTKTQQQRVVPLTLRTKTELIRLKELTEGDKPFPFTDIKRSFATAKRLAEIEDLHFHDLRRTAITRWILAGIPLEIAAKLAGHTQLQTTMKYYTSTDIEMVSNISEKIDAFHSHIQSNELETFFMN